MPPDPDALALDEDRSYAEGNAPRALLRGFACERAPELIVAIGAIAAVSPFGHMVTPGGWAMSMALTNCGKVGWVTDHTGYRYDANDRVNRRSWPAMPHTFADLAAEAADAAAFSSFRPDACLVNRYAPGAPLSLHQDRNERDLDQPIVSVSLGLPAIFLWGGKARAERVPRIPLIHGDVMVWAGRID